MTHINYQLARAAMQGMYPVTDLDLGSKKNIAEVAYWQADAMIEATE